MISAVWAQAAFNQLVDHALGDSGSLMIEETSLGLSGNLTEFELMVPGLLIIALIMLMFTATIAVVVEVENRTILRLKFSKLHTVEFLAGMSVVQVLVGMVSILLTLLVAIACGFSHYAAIGPFILIALLTSLSIIAFSLILAAVTRTVNEVLIVGNFPLFLFMFFTGAAFPLEGKALFSMAGYPVSVQGLMSPTHAISALKKVMVMEMPLSDVLPEIYAILVLTVVYFAVGIWAFRKRHMRVL
jgi:ABC-2 type transport system permease protein